MHFIQRYLFTTEPHLKSSARSYDNSQKPSQKKPPGFRSGEFNREVMRRGCLGRGGRPCEGGSNRSTHLANIGMNIWAGSDGCHIGGNFMKIAGKSAKFRPHLKRLLD